MQGQKFFEDLAILAILAISVILVKTKKSENSSYIPSKYYNRCTILTTKEAKMRK